MHADQHGRDLPKMADLTEHAVLRPVPEIVVLTNERNIDNMNRDNRAGSDRKIPVGLGNVIWTSGG